MKKKYKIFAAPAFLAAAIAGVLIAGTIPGIPGVFTSTVHAEGEGESGSDYDNEYNMLSDEGYKDFSLDITDPAEFTSDDHPLENYDPNPLSWLYVATTNRYTNMSNKGDFAVYNTMPFLDTSNTQKATIKDSDHKINGELQLNPISAMRGQYTPSSNVSVEGYKPKQIGQNAVSIRRGVDKEEAIVQLFIDYAETKKGSQKYKEYMRLTLLERGKDTYNLKSENIFTLTNTAVYKNLDTRAMSAVTAMTAVDLDGDGSDEVAIYMADPERPRIQIFSIRDGKIEDYIPGGGSQWEKNIIDLSRLNDPSDSHQFNKGANSEMPIVSLSATRISGETAEDLVITACVPWSQSQRSMKSAVGIFGMSKDGPIEKFSCHPEFQSKGSNLFLRYPSATDADVDGNQVKELVIGGYESFNGRQLGGSYQFQFIIWKDGGYHLLSDTPAAVPIYNTSSISIHENFSMAAPAVLSAARLNKSSDKDYLLIENIVAEFKPAEKETKTDPSSDGKDTPGGTNITDDGYQALRVGTFEQKLEINSNIESGWGQNHYVAQAVSGHFVQNNAAAEQIALVIADTNTTSLGHNEVTLSIAWLWMENGKIVQYNTNPQYIKRRGANEYGTALILCPVANTSTADYYKYMGKNYGWTMPTPLIATAAIPYWKELRYGGSPGKTSFQFANTVSQGADFQVTLKGSVNVDVSLQVGLKFLGEELQVGGGGGLDVGAQVAGKVALSHEKTSSVSKEGRGENEELFVYARPVINYHYKKYVPETQVTQELLTEYKKRTGKDAEIDGAPVKAGNVIEAGWYDYYVLNQLPGSSSMMDMDTYTELYNKYKAQGQKVTEVNLKDLYYDYTIGDPTTYPSSRDKIKTWIPGEGLTPLGQFSPSTVISPGNGQTTSISLSQSVGGTLAVSLGFDIDSKTYAKGHADLGFVAGGEVDGQIGYTVGSSQELGAELSLSVNGAIGGTLNSPDTKNTAYQFSTAMAAWATFRKVPVAVGFTVTGTEPGKEMPLPPLHPYVYATGKTWAMLAWDQPPEGGRWADGYKIYQDDAATPLNGGKPVDAAACHYLVTNLTPATTYQFQFAGMKGDIEAEKSATVQATTLPDSGPALTGPKDQFKKEGETAEFEVEVQGIDETKDIITYTWQQYDAAGIYQGQWNNIETWGEQTNVLKRTIHADNRSELNGKHYRVKADIQKGGIHSAITTLYSRAATLYVIESDDEARAAVGLTAVYEDGSPLLEYNGEYYINPGEKVTLTATALKSGGQPVDSGAIDIGYQMNQAFERIYKLAEDEGPDENGQVTASLQTGPGTDADEGICRLAAEYRTGNPDDPRAYSAPVIIHIGDEDFVQESYQIEYQLNGGVNAPENPLAIPKNTQGATLADASKDYASFTGWYTAPDTGADSLIADGRLTPDLLQTQAEENGVVTLYAGWQENEYPVTYDLGDSEPADTAAPAVNHPNNPDTYTMNESILLRDPQRPGYTFLGWYTDPERTNRVDYLPPYDASNGNIFTPPEPVTLYAKWQLEAYTITYILDGGSNDQNNPAFYTVESPDIPLKAPSKDGAVFTGWYRNTLPADDTNGKLDTIIRGSTGDLTLYARWDDENKKDPLDKDKDGYWLIHNLGELQLMRDMVNSGGDYATDHYRLCANINGQNSPWSIPAGTEETPFNGTFEGDDYIIDGLILQGTGTCQGIFGKIGPEGLVNNLKTIDLYTDGTFTYAGGIAAVNEGTIVKCTSGLNVGTAPVINGYEIEDISEFNNKITATEAAGGIVGQNDGTIRDSSSNAAVSAGDTAAGTLGKAGGIAGINHGSIANGYNTGEVTSSGPAGGIAGQNKGSIFNQYNCGKVKSSAAAGAGAIAGAMEVDPGESEGMVTECWYNNSELSACPDLDLGGSAQYKKGSDMKKDAFAEALTAAAQSSDPKYNAWNQSNIKNGGYPRIDSNIYQKDTSMDDTTDIQVQTLGVHPHSRLNVRKVDEESGRYKEMQEEAKRQNAELLGVYNISYMFPDGYSSDTEQDLRIHFPMQAGWNSRKLAVLHRVSEGNYQILDGTEQGGNYMAASEGLSTFAVLQYKEEIPNPDGPDIGGNPGDSGYLPVKKTTGRTKTGDTASPLIWVCLLLAAGAGITIGVRREKKHGRRK